MPRRDDGLVPCIGCGGLVPDVDGPVHRYMDASPGCWRAYTELLVGVLPPSPLAPLTVDAYAVTHPGVPGPQSTPSVWIHLVTMCFVLERGWRVDQVVRLRRLVADSFAGWPWLPPPTTMSPVTAIDLSAAALDGDLSAAAALGDAWVESAWVAWAGQHAPVRARTDSLVRAE